jgi:hypothetical protein
MKIDALIQYAKLKQQLTEEQTELQTRLNEINQVLGNEVAAASPPTTTPTAAAEAPAPVAQVKRRGRPPGAKMSIRVLITKALSERGPLSRRELGQALVELGYKSNAKDPMGSIGNFLYGKRSPFKSKDGKFYLPGGTAVGTPVGNGGAEAEAPATKGKLKRSAAVRARMAEAQRASWAKRRKGK